MSITVKETYGTSTPIVCTLASLASSATAGRCSTAVDNTVNLFDEVHVTVGIKTGAGSIANHKAVYIYGYCSEDGTVFEQEESNAPNVDGGYTINSPTIFAGPIVIPVLTAAKVYTKTFLLSQLFGFVPRKWGIIVVNYTGQALDSTEGNHTKTYTGITYTNG